MILQLTIPTLHLTPIRFLIIKPGYFPPNSGMCQYKHIFHLFVTIKIILHNKNRDFDLTLNDTDYKLNHIDANFTRIGDKLTHAQK